MTAAGADPDPRHESGPASAKPALERRVGVSRRTRRRQAPVQSTDGPTARPVSSTLGLENRDRRPAACRATRDAPPSRGRARRGGVAARRGTPSSEGECAVDEIAEHVDVRAIENRRHLDARHEANAGVRTGGGRLVAAGHRIVIGDAENGDAGLGGARDELARRAPAVRRRRVRVEVDHRAERAAAGRRRVGLVAGPLTEGFVLANEQFEMCALFVGKFEEDLLSFRIFKPLAVALEELMRTAFAPDADQQSLLDRSHRAAAARRLRRRDRWPGPLKNRNVGRDSRSGSCARSSAYRRSSVPRCSCSSPASL